MADVTLRTFASLPAGRVLDGQASFGRSRDTPASVHGLVARSAAMARVCRHLERLAPIARATLVTGDVGTGKSLVVEAARRLGPCRHAAVVTFGHREDVALVQSLHEAARASRTPVTCLVPELSDLSATSQAALAAGLAGSGGLPIGEGLHVIAATAIEPVGQMALGRLRADLFHQLSAVRYHMPALADRLEDLRDLAATLLLEVCRQQGVAPRTIASAALDVLVEQHWAGNARQLRNVLARAVALSDGTAIGVHAVRDACAFDAEWPRPAPVVQTDRRTLDAGTRLRVSEALSAAGGNKSVAAARLGVSRRSFYRLLERLDT